MLETYLIKLRDNCCEADFMQVISFLNKDMSQVVMVSLQRCWIVANLDQRLAEAFKSFPMVEMIGGVALRKREVKVIRNQKQ